MSDGNNRFNLFDLDFVCTLLLDEQSLILISFQASFRREERCKGFCKRCTCSKWGSLLSISMSVFFLFLLFISAGTTAQRCFSCRTKSQSLKINWKHTSIQGFFFPFLFFTSFFLPFDLAPPLIHLLDSMRWTKKCLFTHTRRWR